MKQLEKCKSAHQAESHCQQVKVYSFLVFPSLMFCILLFCLSFHVSSIFISTIMGQLCGARSEVSGLRILFWTKEYCHCEAIR